MRYYVGLVVGVVFTFIVCSFYYPRIIYKNTQDFTNGSIRIEEGLQGSNGFQDMPARIDIRANQMKVGIDGLCNIPTGKTEIGYISLEHLNMLDHFAHRYLERKNDGWHGGCRLVIDGKEVIGKDIK